MKTKSQKQQDVKSVKKKELIGLLSECASFVPTLVVAILQLVFINKALQGNQTSCNGGST
jgi:hypothetical protein